MPSPQALELHLFVRDLDAARGFYFDLLGFSVVYESDWFLSFDTGNDVHICCNGRRDDYAEHGSQGRGVKVEFRVSDVDAVHRKLVRFGVPFEFPPETSPGVCAPVERGIQRAIAFGSRRPSRAPNERRLPGRRERHLRG